jgi:uncharacterized membrane protein YuzA (DUF378 family)
MKSKKQEIIGAIIWALVGIGIIWLITELVGAKW